MALESPTLLARLPKTGRRVTGDRNKRAPPHETLRPFGTLLLHILKDSGAFVASLK